MYNEDNAIPITLDVPPAEHHPLGASNVFTAGKFVVTVPDTVTSLVRSINV
jgi:hypothetical protein